MPINRKYQIADLLAVAREFFACRGYGVTFEYVLMAGLTDADADARRLAELTRDIPCKINLIPYNETTDRPLPSARPSAPRASFIKCSKAAASSLPCATAEDGTSTRPVASSTTNKKNELQRTCLGRGRPRGTGVAIGCGLLRLCRTRRPDDPSRGRRHCAVFLSFSRLGHGFGGTAVVFPRRLLHLALSRMDRTLRVGDASGPLVRPTAFGPPPRLDTPGRLARSSP